MQQKKLTPLLTKIYFTLKNKKIYFLAIIINAFLFTYYYGYRGIFPIDSFLIYDAGYKVLNNIHPFKDYWSITGPLLDYVQATLFFLFKVNWFSYVLHAALINCLLASISYYFYLKLGLNKNYSLIYSLGISILAYPTIGTPFMDYHAVIFSLLSIIFLILAFIKDKKKFWFFSSLFLFFSFFSKQIPSAYLIILLLLLISLYFFLINTKKNNNYLFFFFGGIITLFSFYILFVANEIPIKNFLIQYIFYPISIGDNRVTSLSFDLKNIFFQFKFIYLALFPLLIVGIVLIKFKKKSVENKKDLLIILLVLSSALVFIYSQLLTKNQVLIFFLIPFYLGVSQIFVCKYYNKKILIYFIISIFVITSIKYHLRFNEHKKFMELINANFSIAENANVLDASLSGLKWITPKFLTNPILEMEMLNEAKKNIIEDKSNKILITDYQFLASVTNNKFYAPNKWFDDLSVPPKKNKYFQTYKLFFTSKLKEQKIKTLYLIGSSKIGYISFIFDNKECLNYKKINEITLKVDIANCIY